MQPIDEFFLFMVHLSIGLTKRDLGHRFNIHQSTASQIITKWANFLYTILGSVRVWMSEDAVKAQMPKEFKDYPDTQVVIDCIELRCRTPSSPASRWRVPALLQGVNWHSTAWCSHFCVILVCRICQWQWTSEAVWDCVAPETWNGHYGRQRFFCRWRCTMQSLQTCLPVQAGRVPS